MRFRREMPLLPPLGCRHRRVRRPSVTRVLRRCPEPSEHYARSRSEHYAGAPPNMMSPWQGPVTGARNASRKSGGSGPVGDAPYGNGNAVRQQCKSFRHGDHAREQVLPCPHRRRRHRWGPQPQFGPPPQGQPLSSPPGPPGQGPPFGNDNSLPSTNGGPPPGQVNPFPPTGPMPTGPMSPQSPPIESTVNDNDQVGVQFRAGVNVGQGPVQDASILPVEAFPFFRLGDCCSSMTRVS